MANSFSYLPGKARGLRGQRKMKKPCWVFNYRGWFRLERGLFLET